MTPRVRARFRRVNARRFPRSQPPTAGSAAPCYVARVKRRTFSPARSTSLLAALSTELKEARDVSAARLSKGAVFVDGRRVRDDRPVTAEAVISVVMEAAGQSTSAKTAPPAALVVLAETTDVLAVNKPAGLAAQPTPDGAPNLLDLATAQLGTPAGLVHRLDKETSGVTVFGKTKSATTRLAAAFREGRASKEYLAIVSAELPDRGSIDTALQKDPSRPGRWRTLQHGDGLSALTHFEVVLRHDGLCLVRLLPKTGRTHQLRAHLTSLGAPIVGDRLYGGATGPRCLLHARRLEIDGESWEAPVPDDFPLR